MTSKKTRALYSLLEEKTLRVLDQMALYENISRDPPDIEVGVMGAKRLGAILGPPGKIFMCIVAPPDVTELAPHASSKVFILILNKNIYIF